MLEEAANPAVPLLERLRFLSISATNLDEFYTVRVAGLRALVRNGNATLSEDGRSPAEQLSLINADARRLMQTQQTTFNRLRKEMEGEGISIVQRSRLTARDLKHLESHFLSNVFPVLSPWPSTRRIRSRSSRTPGSAWRWSWSGRPTAAR